MDENRAGSLYYDLDARLTKLEDGLKDAEVKIQRSGKKGADDFEQPMAAAQKRVSEGFGKVQKALAAIGIGLGVAGVLTFFNGTINAASDLNEEVSKSQVVFGDASAEVLKFGENASSSIGQSNREALSAAGAFGNMFRTIGLSADASADMSIKMVQLASDMASFNNEDPSDMLDRLRSGLAGEAEPLRRFGVLLSEAAVQQKAVSMGLADANGNISEAAKVQARYALILEQTALQQGDFARTADGLANSQRTLAAVQEDTMARIGSALLPIAKEFTRFAIDTLPAVAGALQMVASAASPVLTLLLELASTLIQHANVLVPALAAALAIKLYSALKDVADGFEIAKLGAKGFWAAALIGLPVLLEIADTLGDWSFSLGKTNEQLKEAARLQASLNLNTDQGHLIYSLAQAVADRYGMTVGFVIDQLNDAVEKGEDWQAVLNDLADGHLDATQSAESLTEKTREETREMQRLATQHHDTASAIRASADEVSHALIDELSKVDEVVPESIRHTAEGIAVTLKNGSTVIAKDGSIADAVRAAVKAADLAAQQEARKIPGDIATSILEGRDAVVQAAEGLAKAATDPLLEEARIGELRKQAKEAASTYQKELKKGTPATRAAAKAAYEQAEIELAGHLLRMDPKSKEAAGILKKYLNSEEPATRAAAQALMDAVRDRADVLKYDVEQDAVATGKALPDALADNRAEAGRQAAATAREVQNNLRLDSYDTGSRIGGDYASGVGSTDNQSKARRAGQALHDAAADAAGKSIYWFGHAVGDSWVQGVIDALGHNSSARQRIAQEARLATLDLRGYSPPRTGPLREIDKWGFNVGSAWIDNFLRPFRETSMGGALMPLSAMLRGAPASAALAAVGGASLSPASATAAAAQGGNTYITEYHLHTDGPVSVESDDDLRRVMDRMLFAVGARGAVGG